MSTKLQTTLNELETTPSLSGPKKQLATSLKEILSHLVAGPVNTSQEYLPISNQVLINQIQNLNEKIDYDFAHAQPSGVFKPVIADIQQSVLQTAAQDPQALESYNAARNAYAAWSDKFNNAYIRPLRDKTNHDYSVLYKTATNLDEFNQLRKILLGSEKGKSFEKTLLRDIAENRLSPFFKGKGNTKEFDQALRELEAVISPTQAKNIRNIFYTPSKLQKQKVTNVQKEHKVSLEKYKKDLKEFAEKNKGKIEIINAVPESISKKADTISGLRELRKELSATKQGQELYKKVAEWKAAQKLTKGEVLPKATSKNYRDVLNDRETRAYLVETLGEERVKDLQAVLDRLDRIEKAFEEYMKAHPKTPYYERAANWIETMESIQKFGFKVTAKGIRTVGKFLSKDNLKKMATLARKLPKFEQSPKQYSQEQFDNLIGDFFKEGSIFGE